MARTYQILYPLLSLFLVRVDLTDLYPVHVRVKIVRVLDADTVEVRRGNQLWRIRLAKIDAPEKTQRFLDGEGDAGKEARACLLRLNPDHYRDLKIDGFDMYGRTLGDVGTLSLDLIQQGCVSLYPYGKFSSEKEKFIYLRAMTEAKNRRRGLWSKSGYLLPKKWRSSSKRIAHRR
jgi:micrococcal nuclease